MTLQEGAPARQGSGETTSGNDRRDDPGVRPAKRPIRLHPHAEGPGGAGLMSTLGRSWGRADLKAPTPLDGGASSSAFGLDAEITCRVYGSRPPRLVIEAAARDPRRF